MSSPIPIVLAFAVVATVTAQAEAPVKVSYMYAGHQAWQLTLDVTPEVKEIFVSLGDAEFKSTGFLTALTGERLPNPLMTIPHVSQTIRVRLVTTQGRTLGPFTFPFDRDRQVVAEYKGGLEDGKSEWLQFREFPRGRWLLYYSYLAGSKSCAIRQARYSVDSDALDQVLTLPACNVDDPYATSQMVGPLTLGKRRPAFAKVKILYGDGTESEVVTFRP